MSRRVLIVAAAFLFSAATLAQAEDARERLDRFAEGLDRLSGEFEQVTIDGGGRVVEESTGRLYFQTPDRFRWNYSDPFPQEMVADGERLWHYDESLEQVTVREQPPASESPLMVLTHPELLDRFYRIEPDDDPDALKFVPLEADAEFEQARLLFDNGVPAGLELIDRFGQTTRLTLTNLQRNPELDEALFIFVPPPGADVLEGY